MPTPDPQEYALYLLMRKDMESLNHAGKMVAQGAHAANHAADAIGSGNYGVEAMARFGQWEKSAPQGFGTTIVYGAIVDREAKRRGLRLDDIKMIVGCATAAGHPAGIVVDPTYPLLDGDTLHAFSVETCGWMFGSRKDLQVFVTNLILHGANSSNF